MVAKLSYVVSALVIGISVLTGVQFSSADWTHDSDYRAGVGAAADWTDPAVAVVDPGFVQSGVVTITVNATDTASSVSSVLLEVRPSAGSTWSEVCTDTDAPYTCSWDTNALTDGTYHLRATATDAYGNAATSAELPVDVLNDAGVVLDTIASPTRGTIGLTAHIGNAGTGASKLTFQYRTSPSGSWQTIAGCLDLSGPDASCPFDSTGLEGTYDFRAEGWRGGSTYYYDTRNGIVIDNTAPGVALAVPGPTYVDETITLTATTSEAGSGVASVLFEHRLASSGTWSTCGTDSSAPYECTLDTTTVGDGDRVFRATATDNAGNTGVATQSRTVDNGAPSVSLTVPGPSYLRGGVNLTASASDAGSGVDTVAFHYRTSPSGSWVTACTDGSAPYTCSFASGSVTDGAYDFRATATDVVGTATTTATQTRTVDNTAPTAPIMVPAGTLGGTVNLTSSATDARSGVQSVDFQYRTSSSGTWTSITGCLDTSSPYACSFDTTTLTDGDYDFRTFVTDNAGNTLGTATPVTRSVSNMVASVAISSPTAGSTIYGATTIAVTASSNKGVTNVAVQYSTNGSTWTTICTDSSSPYECAWNPTSLAYGTYQLRAVMSHGSGLSLTSSTVSVVVPQTGGHDVQGSPSPNGQATVGDAIKLTYNRQMNLATIHSSLTLANPVSTTAAFANGTPDRVTFASTNLGTVFFAQNYVTGSLNYNVTVSAANVTLNGATVTEITISFDSRIGGNSGAATSSATGAMTWTPSATAKDTNGSSASTATVTESGAADMDL